MNAEEQKQAELLKIIEKYEKDKKRNSECPACASTNLALYPKQTEKTHPKFEHYTKLLICRDCCTKLAEHIYSPKFYSEYINKCYKL